MSEIREASVICCPPFSRFQPLLADRWKQSKGKGGGENKMIVVCDDKAGTCARVAHVPPRQQQQLMNNA